MKKILKIVGLIFLGLLIKNIITDSNLSTLSTATTGTSGTQSRENVLRKIRIENFNWYKGAFDTVMLVDFVLKNDNDFPVKDLTVECVHTAPSGTKIDENTRTIYEVILAHGSKRMSKFNMGFIHTQVERSTCYIKDYQPI